MTKHSTPKRSPPIWAPITMNFMSAGRTLLGSSPNCPRYYDEPLADISQIPTCLLSQLARRHVTVAAPRRGRRGLCRLLTYDEALHAWFKARRIPLGVRRRVVAATRAAQRLRGLPFNSPPSRMIKLPRRWHRRASRLTPWASALSAVSAADMLQRFRMHDPFADAIPDRSRNRRLHSEHSEPAQAEAALAEMMYMDFVGFMTDDILVKVDRASMAVGLEVRCPFLDHRVVEFAWSLPMPFRKDDSGGKRVLRALLAKHMPRSLFERAEAGFQCALRLVRRSTARLGKRSCEQGGIGRPGLLRCGRGGAPVPPATSRLGKTRWPHLSSVGLSGLARCTGATPTDAAAQPAVTATA